MSEEKRDRDRRPGGGPDRKAKVDGESATGPRTRLTERQRRQARELRKKRGRPDSAGRRRRPAGVRAGNVISRGVRATAVEIARALRFLGRGATAFAGRIGSIFLIGVEGLLALGAVVLALSVRAIVFVASAASRAARRLDRLVTPFRAVLMVSVLAGITLAISQFMDYSAVEIGSSGYDPILDLTRAPRTDVETPIAAHSVVLLIGSLFALAGSAGLILTGRRLYGLPILAVGVIALVVGLAVDLPRGLDAAAASSAYADAEPILLAGFWLEVASGAVLVAGGLITALGLARERSALPDRGLTAADRSKERRRKRAGVAAGGAA